MRHDFAFRTACRTRCGIDLSLVNNFERRLIEVASFVRVRIEEETLGATFHFGQDFRIYRIIRIFEWFLQDAACLFENGVDFGVFFFGFGGGFSLRGWSWFLSPVF